MFKGKNKTRKTKRKRRKGGYEEGGGRCLRCLKTYTQARRRSPVLSPSRTHSYAQACTKRAQTSAVQNKTNTNKPKSELCNHKQVKASPVKHKQAQGWRRLENGGRGVDGAGTFRRRDGTRPKYGGGGGTGACRDMRRRHGDMPCQHDAGVSLRTGLDRVPSS